jgi:hypothetical protein
MEWIVNSLGDDFKNILFQYEGRNWEITLDLNEVNVDYFVSKRIAELEVSDLDEADLIVDWTTKNDMNNGY